jgi:Tfp pilus assembly protein PilF
MILRRTIVLLLLIGLLLGACRPGAGIDVDTEISATESSAAASQGAAELVEQGKALLEADHCQAALEPLERAVQLEPELLDAQLAVGNAYTRLGRLDDAIDAYRKALEADADFAAAYTNLGAAYLRQINPGADSEAATTQIQSAIDSFRTALQLEPEDAETHANLGSALLKASQIPQAKEEFEEALRLNHDLPEARVALGYLHLLTGQSEEAVNELERAVKLAPEMPEAHYALGLAYAESNQLEKAIGAFEAFMATEIPADCAGDIAAAAQARQQAALVLEQLRSQQ